MIKIYEGGDFIYPKEQQLRDILDPYGSEYLAFDLGFQICLHYELNRSDKDSTRVSIPITEEFIIDICHMLKFKNVSPHSVHMIYRALFLGR